MNGNIENVLNNIRKLNEHKKNYRSKYPRLTWQFVIFGHNEHELPLAKKMARELGMDFWPKLNHDPVYSPVKDKELVKRESGLRAASRTEFKEIRKRDYNFPCAHLWEDPQINWDGKLLGCSVNVWDDFGDVFQDGLKKTLNGERFKYAKAMVLGKVAVRKDIPCCNCSIYKNLPFAKTNSESTGAWAFSSLRNRR